MKNRILYFLLALAALVSCGKTDPSEGGGEEGGGTENLPVQLFSETFSGKLGSFTVNNVKQGGLPSNVWTINPEHPEYGAIASGYSGGKRYQVEGWLISPDIEINKGYKEVYLRFNHAIAYANGESLDKFISVKISDNGGQSWTGKAIPNSPSAYSRFETVPSGDIPLTPYIGKTIKIALVYVSTQETQPTWEVMNLEVSSEKKEIPKDDLGDTYKSVPAWMEMPAVKEGQAFYVHTAPFEDRNVRNYSFIYNDTHLVAEWVAYPLCDMYTKKRVDRTDAWAADPFVTKQAVYAKAGDIYDSKGGTRASYNRGHQLPSADRLGSTKMNEQTFYYTNIAPQLADDAFNAGIWEDLEEAVRGWSASSNSTDTLYVVTGCLVDKPIETRKDNDGKTVSIPNAFYKAVLRLSKGSYIGAAFYLDHKDYSGQPVTLKAFALSIDQLEEKLGMDFFVNLPAETAEKVEAENPVNNKFWNLK